MLATTYLHFFVSFSVHRLNEITLVPQCCSLLSISLYSADWPSDRISAPPPLIAWGRRWNVLAAFEKLETSSVPLWTEHNSLAVTPIPFNGISMRSPFTTGRPNNTTAVDSAFREQQNECYHDSRSCIKPVMHYRWTAASLGKLLKTQKNAKHCLKVVHAGLKLTLSDRSDQVNQIMISKQYFMNLFVWVYALN